MYPEQGRLVCRAPGAPFLPRLLTRCPALPQQLVKVAASVKIKEMHTAFIAFLLGLSFSVSNCECERAL